MVMAPFALIGAAALLAGQAAAFTTCVVGKVYCGFALGNQVPPEGSIADGAIWRPRIADALTRAGAPLTSQYATQTLFKCANATTLDFVDYCIDNRPGGACQPPQNPTCRPSGSYCCA